ncbi:MAG: TRAP transporter small permease [Rhodobacteraceae bacterium]|nr:MAG: TRAP transporter small permease [Paracoccaceae bacterium]
MHAAMIALSRTLAILGGVILSGMILMTCLSIAGRQLAALLNSAAVQDTMPALANAVLGWGIGRVFGDFEMIELGMAIAVFCFLPYCHITIGHARVNIFTSALPDRVNRWLRLLIEAAFVMTLVLIAWRLSVGMSNRLRTGQTTFLLEWPLWIPYAACLVAACAAVLVAAYMLGVRLAEAFGNRDIIGEEQEAEH